MRIVRITLCAGVLLATVVFTLGSVAWAGGLGQATGPAAQENVEAMLGTVFTYQGNLRKSGQPVNDSCSFRFSLWDALTGGVEQGSTQTLNSVQVQAGVFSVQLDFGNQFTGDARWLQTAVKCSGESAYTMLTPRQPVNAVPYALGLQPGAVVVTSNVDVPAITVSAPYSNSNALVATGNGEGYAVIFAEDTSEGGGFGLFGTSTAGTGVYGASSADDSLKPGVHGVSQGDTGVGVFGEATGDNGVGVRGMGDNTGVSGSGRVGVYGDSTDGTGIFGAVESGRAGVRALSFATEDNSYALLAELFSNAPGASSAAVYGKNYGLGASGIGVWGLQQGAGYGVFGSTTGAGYGVVGTSPSPGYAGYFNGNVQVTGTLSKGGGSFKIDHPLDPANQYLSHSFVESPDMMNIYNGNITTDGAGYAIVTLPNYFEALNQDFRYQLTVIGQFAQAIVVDEIEGNQFRLQTDKPEVKVSWQVTGIRHDPFAEANRIPVEEMKTGNEKGRYLYPEVYGLDAKESTWYRTSPNAQALLDHPDLFDSAPASEVRE